MQRAIQQGQTAIASAIAWGYGRLSKDIVSLKSEVNARLDTLIEQGKRQSQNWAYEQFEIARRNFKKGLYEEARDRVELAIAGLPPNHLGYKEEFWFHYLLGNIRLGSWGGDKPNIDESIVDAALAEKAFLTAARYAENEADRSEAFLCAGRSAFVLRGLTRAIEHTMQALSGSRRPADVHYQLAKCYAGLPDSAGGGDAGQHLRKALEYNLDLVLDVWAEEAYFNRVGALEVALLQAASKFRAEARTEADNYRLAGCFATFAKGRAESVYHLRVAVDKKLDILHDAWADEARLNRDGILDEVLQGKIAELQAKLKRELDYFAQVMQFARTLRHRGFSASELLERELSALDAAIAAASNEAARGGVLDLDVAVGMLAAQHVELKRLQSTYLYRLEEALRARWKGTKPPRRADDAENARQRRSNELENARPAIDAPSANIGCWAIILAAAIGPIGWIIGGTVAFWAALSGVAWLVFWFNRGWKRGALEEAETLAALRRAEAEKSWQAELEIVQAARDTAWP